MDTLSLTIDPKTGHISGIIPAGAGNAAGDPVTFFADDGVTRIFYPTMISTTSAGGSDFGFAVSFTSLPNGEVGTDYAPVTVPIQGGSFPTSGLTNIRFGAADLPPGLSMNGLTGVISGNPTAAGTYYVTITAVDREKSMEAVVVVPLLVYPKGSTFKFDTVILDNGEVNVAYNYQVLVSGQQGSGGGLSYSASGLPPGVDINPDTGLISGTPTAAGTFNVIVTAGKGNENIQINRPLVIVPNGTNFFWQYSGQPAAAFLNTTYGAPNNPTFVLNTQPAGVYSAVGLPPGITYNSASGELSGVATEVGIYPVTFTATDSASGAQITFTYEYIVFPPNGGDTNSLPINIWVKKMAFKRGSPGKDSWQAQWIYNADRRLTTNPVRIYDASTDPLVMSLGSIPEVNIPRASLTGSRPKFAYKAGAISAKLDESAQTIALTDKSLTINDRYKTTLENRVRLGQKAYILDLYFDDKGKFTPALGYRKTAFVASSIKASVKAATKDSASFSMLLGSPSFVYPATGDVKTVLFRLYNSSGTLVVEKDFTSIVTFTTATDKATGAKVYKLKSGKDAAAPVGKFSYDSKSGKMTVAFKGLSLGGLLTAAEEQVSIEMQIADKTYYTGVTIFAPKAGSYSTKLPK
jgi:hypothetical protein